MAEKSKEGKSKKEEIKAAFEEQAERQQYWTNELKIEETKAKVLQLRDSSMSKTETELHKLPLPEELPKPEVTGDEAAEAESEAASEEPSD